MRRILTRHSSKAERIFYEVLKEFHIPFRHRWIVSGREIDFIVGHHAIEIDGHDQDGSKNELLAKEGYVPIHLHNSEVTRDAVINLIKRLKCL